MKVRRVNHHRNGSASFLAVAVLSLSCGSFFGETFKSHDSDAVLRVLFIGNSLTYKNDLPSIVQAFAEATAQKPFAFKAVVFGGFSLEDHWTRGDSRSEIAKGGWKFVVLQQGPSASTDGRRSLLEYARRFDQEIRRVGARPALYMVWPSGNRMQDFDGVSESYSLAARAVNGLLLPAVIRGALPGNSIRASSFIRRTDFIQR